MKSFIKTAPATEQSEEAENNISRELSTDMEMERIPFMKLPFLAKDIHVNTREA